MTTTIPGPLSGHVSLIDEDEGASEDADTTVRLRSPWPQPHERQPLTASLLLPPSAEATRSSYMTTSTNGSRMSGLSDFPAPPGDVAAHMRLIETYLGDGPPARSGHRRMTFGVDEDVEDIARALSTSDR